MQAVVTQLFKKGNPVLVSGQYLCVPCGYVQYFAAGTRFTECFACLAGTAYGPEGYREGEAEFWQYLE